VIVVLNKIRIEHVFYDLLKAFVISLTTKICYFKIFCILSVMFIVGATLNYFPRTDASLLRKYAIGLMGLKQG
jgi:hypothetical protein